MVIRLTGLGQIEVFQAVQHFLLNTKVIFCGGYHESTVPLRVVIHLF